LDSGPEPQEGNPYFNNHALHQAYTWIAQVGFQSRELIPFTPDLDICHKGSEYFEYRYLHFQMTASVDEMWERLVARGAVSEDGQQAAKKEIEVWYNHPHAFFMQPRLAACGRVG
jgi:hypothetical protein